MTFGRISITIEYTNGTLNDDYSQELNSTNTYISMTANSSGITTNAAKAEPHFGSSSFDLHNINKVLPKKPEFGNLIKISAGACLSRSNPPETYSPSPGYLLVLVREESNYEITIKITAFTPPNLSYITVTRKVKTSSNPDIFDSTSYNKSVN